MEEPHSAICTERPEESVLDLTAAESRENRKATLDLVRDGPSHLQTAQRSLLDFARQGQEPSRVPGFTMPRRHALVARLDIDDLGRKALQAAYELQPES